MTHSKLIIYNIAFKICKNAWTKYHLQQCITCKSRHLFLLRQQAMSTIGVICQSLSDSVIQLICYQFLIGRNNTRKAYAAATCMTNSWYKLLLNIIKVKCSAIFVWTIISCYKNIFHPPVYLAMSPFMYIQRLSISIFQQKNC